MTKFDPLIDRLAGEAVPVRPQSGRLGRLAFGLVASATVLATGLLLGFRSDLASFGPEPGIALSAGLMMLLALAAGLAAIRMAAPQVGAPASGAPWALAALSLLPIVALAGLAAGRIAPSAFAPAEGLGCLATGLLAGSATFAFLGFWLRRGAPVRPESAAWAAGLAAGAVGALSATLECPIDSLAHVGVWHVAAVPLAGVAARLVLPRLIRW